MADANLYTKLNDGTEIPTVGLGVYLAEGNDCYQAILDALAAGYRHIDTAAFYQNEEQVGKAIRDSGIPREQIYVTTKLWNSDHGYDKTIKALNTSLKKLGLEYVNLYLIHAPVQGLRLETWRAFEHLRETGKTKSIGVSNYGVHHLEELMRASKIIPVVNQVEWTPYNTRTELVAFCEKHGIVVESYCPLTRGRKINDPKLVTIAQKYNKTTAQLLIRWVIQRNGVVIPKSTNKARILENFDVFNFSITEEDLKTLDSFDEYLVVGWDPTVSA